MKCSYIESDGTRCRNDVKNDIYCKMHREIMQMQGKGEPTYTMTYTVTRNASLKDVQSGKADHSAEENKKMS